MSGFVNFKLNTYSIYLIQYKNNYSLCEFVFITVLREMILKLLKMHNLRVCAYKN